jgi:adenylate cyclase
MAAKSPRRRHLAAIVAADVVGYSRLMGDDEEGTLSGIKDHRIELIDPKTLEHGGRLFKTMGDGLLIEFSSVVDAVKCAVDIQRAMSERNAGVIPENRIEFRIGINLGDVIAEDGDVFGDGVNVAARLKTLAAPGGICVSRSVRDHIRDRLPLGLHDLGLQSVKNIARPIRVFQIKLVGGAPVEPPSAPEVASTPPPLSIVVLPFANLSSDPDQEYFADSIVEDLTTDLSRIAGSFVIARNTAFTYKGKAVDARQIGVELGVRYMLEGSMRRLGRQVRVNVQLIDTHSGGHVWADRLDGSVDDLFALQETVTANVATSLSLTMIDASARHASDRENPDAVDLVLRGRSAALRPRTRENLAEARDYYERTLKLAPNSAEAKIGLAEVLGAGVLSLVSDDRDADLFRGDKLVSDALKSQFNSAWAHYAKGEILRAAHRSVEAASEYEIAISLDRNFVPALANLGFAKILTGEPADAIPLLERAIRASPRDPTMAIWYSRIGIAEMYLDRPEQALLALQRSYALNPRLPWVHFYLAAVFGVLGNIAAAVSSPAEAQRLSGDLASIARYKTISQVTDPRAQALRNASIVRGLQLAGLPEA